MKFAKYTPYIRWGKPPCLCARGSYCVLREAYRVVFGGKAKEKREEIKNWFDGVLNFSIVGHRARRGK